MDPAEAREVTKPRNTEFTELKKELLPEPISPSRKIFMFGSKTLFHTNA